MPLSVLVIIVAIGLAIVIGAVHFFGGARSGILDENSVQRLWDREFDGEEIENIIVSDDRGAAFVILPDPFALGLVRQMGAHHIVRRLEADSTFRFRDTGDGIDLELGETTLPRLVTKLADGQRRKEVVSRLEAVTSQEGKAHA